MALSRSEKLKGQRESEKKRCAKVRKNFEIVAIESEKRRKRYAKIKSTNVNLSIRDTRERKKWRITKRKYHQSTIESQPKEQTKLQQIDKRIREKKLRSRQLKNRKNKKLEAMRKRTEMLEKNVSKYKQRYHRRRKTTLTSSFISSLKKEMK